jgi:hypothetical protein
VWETGKEDLLEKYVKGDERSTLIHWGPITLVVGQSGWCHLPARSRLRPFLVWTCSSGLAEAPAVRREIQLPPSGMGWTVRRPLLLQVRAEVLPR